MEGIFKNIEDCKTSLIESGFEEKNISETHHENYKHFSRNNTVINPLTKKLVDTALVVIYEDNSCNVLFG